MEIEYKCKRCKKTVKARVYRTNFKNGKSDKDHIRVDCGECGRYIKFIGNRELTDIYPGWEHEITSERKQEKQLGEPSLAEMNFKLDLILDHFGIRDTYHQNKRRLENEGQNWKNSIQRLS